MRATNAMTIDLPAFGVRSIEVPSFPGDRGSVKGVLRFHLLLSPAFPMKKARRTSNVPRASSPGLAACVQCARRAGRLQGPRDLTIPQTACKVRRLMTTSALSRIPASSISLAGACAVILFVVISILPH
jgi:hypothetical protein